MSSSLDPTIAERTPIELGSRTAGRKKVLVVLGSLERAGAQLRTLEICHELRERYSVQFDFCLLGRGPDKLHREVQEIARSVHTLSVRSPRFPLELSRVLRNDRYDVVTSIPKYLSGVILWLAAKQRVPVRIVNFRNSLGYAEGWTPGTDGGRPLLAKPPFIWLMRRLVKGYATHVTAVSRSALDTMFPPTWQSGQDCRIIFDGIPLAPFRERADPSGVRDEFGWPSDSRLLINVGRMSPQKNHGTLLEATRLAYERDKSIRLLLVGDGRLQDEVKRLVTYFGLRDMCVMTRDRADVPRLLLASNVFFFPSLWEGLPIAALEALASGLPIVGSDIGPLREIAPYFPGSFLLGPPNAVAEHAEHIRLALEIPIDHYHARAQFEASPFSLDNSIEAYGSLYGVS